MVNLKKVLMEMGNKLVLEHGFDPGGTANGRADHLRFTMSAVTVTDTNTQAICEFTEWLNRVTEAREVLAEMGIEWPVVKTPTEKA